MATAAPIAQPPAQQPEAPQAAPTNTITLQVSSARTEPRSGVTAGDPITTYKWIINVDNTGDPFDAETDCRPTVPGATDPDYLSQCDWPSVHTIRGSSPIFAQGTSDELNGTTSITLPNGKYVISVTADGYKIDGQWFCIVEQRPGVPCAEPVQESAPGQPGLVQVQMQPYPLPPATLRIKVFVDDGFTNGQFDAPAEDPAALDVNGNPIFPNGDPALASHLIDVLDQDGNPTGIKERVGFKAHLGDPLGEISTDVFGNPLCTEYDANGEPLPDTNYQACLFSDEYGNIAIPNIGPNRYEVWVVPPDGEQWIETTTLEGNFGWDTWLQEGATGFDTEFVVGAEPFPWTIFGFVPGVKNDLVDLNVTGGIEGDVHVARVYVPWNAGNAYQGDIWGGFRGVRDGGPFAGARIALASIALGDQLVYVGQADANGHFVIPHVPDGNYTLTYWDDPLLYLLDFQQVTVANGQITYIGDANGNGQLDPLEDKNGNGLLDPGEDLNGNGLLDPGENPLHLTGWWTTIEGTVFLDNGIAADGTPLAAGARANGKRDCYGSDVATTCEGGVFNYPLVIKSRGNNVVERGAVATVTGTDGTYEMSNVYPFGWWMVLEAYTDRYYTTGVTGYNVDFTPLLPFNDPNANPFNQNLQDTANPVYIEGQGVDVYFLPIIGQTGRIDWGVLPYDPTGRSGDLQNGGIVGTVSYDTTRNELDPRYAAVENWQPGIPGLTVNLYETVKCTDPLTQTCDPTDKFQIEPDGSLTKGALLQTAITESFEQPTGCVSRDALGRKTVEEALPRAADAKCLEGPMMGFQMGSQFATVDGNYGFGDLPVGDYLVEVVIPTEGDVWGPAAVNPSRPLYQVTREDDINVFSGDEFAPLLPPPSCAGPLQLVNSSDNPTFSAEGGSPWEGVYRPTCDVKLVQLGSGRSIAPTFNLYTDVPIPGKYYGYIIDDLNLATNPNALFFGEKNGIAAPIGLYDFTNRLVTTVTSDPHGVFDVLLPSTDTINCPSPSGICANLYRLVGNDPGQPGHYNPNYNPQFRTISASFEVWPGIIMAADLAPTQMGVSIQAPGSQFNNAAQCTLDAATPQIYALSKPFVRSSDAGAARNITITGTGFGAQGPNSKVMLGNVLLTVLSWTDRQIVVDVPALTPANSASLRGPRQLTVTADNGQTTVNGITVHVLTSTGTSAGNGLVNTTNYNPRILTVNANPPMAGITNFASIQAALNQAAADVNPNRRYLVTVFPGPTGLFNPYGAYYENVVMHSPVKLQGVGPGGSYPDNTGVPGSIISGLGFGADTQAAGDWRALIASLNIATPVAGELVFPEGQTVSVVAHSTLQFNTSTYKASIDGFSIEGGDQMGFPNNLNFIGGAQNGQPPVVETQGGGIFVYAYANYLQITNNLIKNNSGSYGGGIRIGTPNAFDGHNDNMVIARNRIYANGGTNLAGGVGVFEGARNYEIANNDLCGNFSAEYGGGISVYGLSPNGKIHHNRIYFNRSYDEGGGVMIAGELPADPLTLSPGTGPVDIYANLVQANLSNDDGGGIRFLMSAGPSNAAFNVYNNIIVNNIATHEGGGVAIDDAPNVRFFNNTVMKNITTATAVTSDGNAAPAGLATTHNSAVLQAILPVGSPDFSDPLMFNNIFWDNRSGKYNGSNVSGIGLTGDPNPIRHWDLGSAEPGIVLTPTNTILNGDTVLPGDTTFPYEAPAYDASNLIGADPQVVATYDTSVAVMPWRAMPNGLVGIALVAVELPPNLMGNYHLADGSPAINLGAMSKNGVFAPCDDIDGNGRPNGGTPDAGADEIAGAVACGMHVGDLDGFSANLSGALIDYWRATVTIRAHDNYDQPVAGAVVSGAWSTGGVSTCTTNAAGQCNVTSPNINKAITTTTFTVTSMTGTRPYDPARNHDPEADSNGTAIVVTRPTMHIGDLDGTFINEPASPITQWRAAVTIRVHTQSETNLAGAMVSGTWSTGAPGTCITNASGLCTVLLPSLDKATVASVDFTVTSVSNGYLYNPAANHDPEADSNGTTITVTPSFIHVGDVGGVKANVTVTTWRATETVTVHNAAEGTVAGAVVSYTWSWAGGSTSGTCTTNLSGQCILSRNFNKTSQPSATFTVTNITKSTAPVSLYQPSANHDNDGDSVIGATTVANTVTWP